MTFQHFLLTNFNVRLSKFSQDGNGRPVLTEEWLEHRLILFERFCLPSVLGQTNLGFTWLVRYDDAMPGARGRLQRYTSFANLRVVPADLKFREVIPALLLPGTEYVVTTRLDNDDALHREAIADIQACVEPRAAEFLNFTFGYRYTAADGRATRKENRSNAFLTLVERVTDAPLHTVRRVDHRHASQLAPVRQIGTEPRWMYVVHDRNLVPRPLSPASVPEDPERAFNLGSYGRQLLSRCIADSIER